MAREEERIRAATIAVRVFMVVASLTNVMIEA
jgi:hypothetical protein